MLSLTPEKNLLITFLLMSVAAILMMMFSAFIAHSMALQHSEKGTKKLNQTVWLTIILISIWFGIAMSASLSGPIAFVQFLPYFAIPLVIGTLLIFQPVVSTLIQKIPTHWLINLQLYRVLGIVFIYPFYTDGLLTKGFAINAGVGDVITGFAAVVVAYLVVRHGKRVQSLFYGWTAFGILDLIVAPASAAYYGFAVNGADIGFPVTIIPLFIGPPVGILLHIVTLRNFRLNYK
ncbi:MAG: hypothetical protein ACRBHB_06945 [Arenicella sp.]